MSAAGKKRKYDEESTKFYAVKAGHTPGVFESWAKCQESITGFKGSQFKSFSSRKDAVDFVAGKVVKDTSASQPEKFYGVAVGHKPGVYTDWEDCKVQIFNVKGPKYKKFATRAEAEAFVKSGGKAPASKKIAEQVPKDVKKPKQQVPVDLGADDWDRYFNEPESLIVEERWLMDEAGPSAKRARTSSMGNSGTKSSAVIEVVVNTDGSSLGNGKFGAQAGVGAYFNDNDPRNVSERLKGQPQTNQRAELMAIQRALEIVSKTDHIKIRTDSNYSINCVTVWYKNWVKKGWKNAKGVEVMNQDIIRPIRTLIEQRDQMGVRTTFEWVKGHSNDPGNEKADRLAVAGARMPL